MNFTLASGTEVTVNKTADATYDFILTPTEGSSDRFTYVQDDRPKSEWDESLEFEKLDALRTFWLKTEDIV